jgi:hypothetical protein
MGMDDSDAPRVLALNLTVAIIDKVNLQAGHALHDPDKWRDWVLDLYGRCIKEVIKSHS